LDGIFKLGVTMAQRPIIEETSEVIADALQNASEELGTLPPKLGQQLGELNLKITSTARRAAESAGAMWKATHKQVRKNPGAAVSIGALLGFAIGFLVSRRD
jgi:ElaB/YqjD/DUF883 family membrane-anchored ribosome-binding protein